MELKTYQRQTLNDLERYIDTLNYSNSLSGAYSTYWAEKGVSVNSIDGYLHPYVNSVAGVPRVTLKVPTAGGKTFIACNAIKTVTDNLLTENLNKVVAWFVPSDTILKQTLEKLQDPCHPYRQRINALFSHRVTVIDKEAALTGQGLSPAALRDNLTILVLSAQSFIETVNVKSAKTSEQAKPRAFRENEYLAENTKYYNHPERIINGADPTALIQVIAQEKPIVIVDESHNFKAELRVELLNNICPRFILELTATPRENSNIISFVDAMQLKRENMVKLPVIVENHNSPKDVLVNAIRMRNSLEKHATNMERRGGKYVRPIALFQAQPKTDNDNITFDKIKANLISFGIPEEQIKIKTANKDELKGIDLMTRQCPVRYIITVNALKEGWDCPFAYILATLANKSSAVDVEQILGRILRQPHTTRHDDDLLNLSYVFTSSNDFRRTIEAVINSLMKAGFSNKDFREAETSAPQERGQSTPIKIPGLFDETDSSVDDTNDDADDEITISTNEAETIKQQLNDERPSDEITHLQNEALRLSNEYNKETYEEKTYDTLPNMPKEKYYLIKSCYREPAENMVLPMFSVRTAPSVFSNGEWMPLQKSMLSEGFDIEAKDASVDFTTGRQDGTIIDIAENGDSYVPVSKRSDKVIDYIRTQYVDKSALVQKEMLSKQIAHMIKIDCIPEPSIIKYVRRVIENLASDEIYNLLDNLYLTKETIQEKIENLLGDYREDVFKKWLDVSRIQLKPQYTFPKRITFAKDRLVGIDKGLYTEEETVNNFEYKVISAVAENDNVLFWHRNQDKRGFCINGFINHYPDFIVRMKSGNTVLIETKGNHLNNEDSKRKIYLGRKWADLAGASYHYFMVFDNIDVEGAINIKTLMEYLKDL